MAVHDVKQENICNGVIQPQLKTIRKIQEHSARVQKTRANKTYDGPRLVDYVVLEMRV